MEEIPIQDRPVVPSECVLVNKVELLDLIQVTKAMNHCLAEMVDAVQAMTGVLRSMDADLTRRRGVTSRSL